MDGATAENHSLMFKLQSDKDKIIQSGELPAKKNTRTKTRFSAMIDLWHMYISSSRQEKETMG